MKDREATEDKVKLTFAPFDRTDSVCEYCLKDPTNPYV
ncbi:hypothetical protein LCGC14_2805600, partial [marine sediment metagenome]